MKAGKQVKLDLKYVIATLIAVLFMAVFGYQFTQRGPEKHVEVLKTEAIKPTIAGSETSVRVAACCKAPNSRSRIMAVRNTITRIAPPQK